MSESLIAKFLIDTRFKKAYRLGVPIARPVSRMFREAGNISFTEFLEDGLSVLVTSILESGEATFSAHILGKQHLASGMVTGFRQYYGRCYQISKNAANAAR